MERRRTTHVISQTEALPTEARHEKPGFVLFPSCRCRFRAHHAISWFVPDDSGSLNAQLYPSDANSIHQREVHAVVVDMPQRASLEFASPETWGALPTFDPPEEESPAKSVLQVALN